MLATAGCMRAQQPEKTQSPPPVSPAAVPRAASPDSISGKVVVPKDWLLKYKLDPNDPNINNEDPDGDGFTNLEEFLAGTDPTNKNSHPPYATKLFLEKTIQMHLRIIFNGRTDPRTYQIDTIDISQPTQYLHMGDRIAGTKYKIVGFKEKHQKDANGIDHEVSELTIQNTETGEKAVLAMGTVEDDPDLYAVFKYFWGKPVEIKVKQGDTFTLDPENDVTYKFVFAAKDFARIVNLKTNETLTIPVLKGTETFHLLK